MSDQEEIQISEETLLELEDIFDIGPESLMGVPISAKIVDAANVVTEQIRVGVPFALKGDLNGPAQIEGSNDLLIFVVFDRNANHLIINPPPAIRLRGGETDYTYPFRADASWGQNVRIAVFRFFTHNGYHTCGAWRHFVKTDITVIVAEEGYQTRDEETDKDGVKSLMGVPISIVVTATGTHKETGRVSPNDTMTVFTFLDREVRASDKKLILSFYTDATLQHPINIHGLTTNKMPVPIISGNDYAISSPPIRLDVPLGLQSAVVKAERQDGTPTDPYKTTVIRFN